MWGRAQVTCVTSSVDARGTGDADEACAVRGESVEARKRALNRAPTSSARAERKGDGGAAIGGANIVRK